MLRNCGRRGLNRAEEVRRRDGQGLGCAEKVKSCGGQGVSCAGKVKNRDGQGLTCAEKIESCDKRGLNHAQKIISCIKRMYGAESDFTAEEKITCTLQTAAVTIFLGLFFYKSFIAVILMIPVGVFYLTLIFKKKTEEKRERLRSEFKDAILSVAANLRTGYAVENAFRETLQEMKLLHGRESAIYRELYQIIQGLANGGTIETLMRQFAKKTGLTEIQEFADVFALAKRSGGNLAEIIYETAAVIGEKIEVEKEIQVLTSAKRLEQNIMSAVPFAIVLYVGATSKGYFDVLYTTAAGRAIMTACLGIYLTAYILGKKIAEIQV